MAWDIHDVLALSQHYMPYFAHWIWQVVPIPDRRVPKMATDCYCRLYYHPEVIAGLPLRDSAAIVLHEILHVQGRHADRAKAMGLSNKRELATWNIAADLAVNGILLSPQIGVAAHSGWLGEHGCTPKRFGLPDGLTAEEYYALLVKADEDGAPGVQQAIEAAMAQRARSMAGVGADQPDGPNGDGQPGEDGQGGGTRDGKQAVPGMGSSSVDGEARPWDKGEPREGNAGLPKWKRDRIDAATAEAIEQHERQHGIGTVPGQWARRVRKIIDPPVDPMTALRSAVRFAVTHERGYGDYTWSRPARREPAGVGYVVPATVRPVPNVAVLVDTSGSMGADDLARALGVIRRALRSLDSVQVYSADTEVHSCQRVFSERRVALLGGGGTNMDVAMQQVAADSRCDAMIVVTDGMTPWPAEPPCRQVVIALTQETDMPTPDWARVVKLFREAA